MKSELKKTIRCLAVVCMSALVLFALASCGGDQQSAQTQNDAQKPTETASTTAETAAQIAVPDVTKMKQADAAKAIEKVGLDVGDVIKKESETVDAGMVISQDPKAGTMLGEGDEVSLVISAGKKAESAQVPNVLKKERADAESVLKAAGFESVYEGQIESLTIKPGLVARQTPNAGATASKGDKVKIYVAKHPAKVSVPSLTKRTVDDATAIAKKYTLSIAYTTKHSSTVKKGLVISQDPTVGSEVAGGSTIKLVVSDGPDKSAAKKSTKDTSSQKSSEKSSAKQPSPKPAEKKVQVTVPKVVDLEWSKAKKTMESAGLTVRQKGSSDGIVDEQDIAAGKKVDKGTTVTLTVVKTVKVPDLDGESAMSAFDTLDELGLEVARNTPQHGTVVGQSPKAGTVVKVGTVVKLDIDTSEFE